MQHVIIVGISASVALHMVLYKSEYYYYYHYCCRRAHVLGRVVVFNLV